MEIVLFTGVGIALYLICDRLLVMLETMHGQRLPYRNVVFLVLMLTLTLSTFNLLGGLFAPGEGTEHNYQEQQATDGGDQSPQAH